MANHPTQREAARKLLTRHGMARLSELQKAGITAATLSRMIETGEAVRLARGLYQLADAPLHADQSLAEAAKLVPKGIVCLVSALAFHGLTDQLPRRVWLAIGQKDWAPKGKGAVVRIVRFTNRLLDHGIVSHTIDGIPVRVYSPAKTIADCFRHRAKIGLPVAIEGLQQALRQRKATPDAIMREAERGGVLTVIRPYIEALTANA